MLHSGHAKTIAGSAEIGNNLDIQHHTPIFVIEDVAMDDKFTDIPVIVRANVNLVSVLDKDRIPEGVIHVAVLICKPLLVGSLVRLAATARVVDGLLASVGRSARYIHNFERVHMDVEDMRLAGCTQNPIVRGIHLPLEVHHIGVIGFPVDHKVDPGAVAKDVEVRFLRRRWRSGRQFDKRRPGSQVAAQQPGTNRLRQLRVAVEERLLHIGLWVDCYRVPALHMHIGQKLRNGWTRAASVAVVGAHIGGRSLVKQAIVAVFRENEQETSLR